MSDGDGLIRRTRWVGPGERPALTWTSAPADRRPADGILILPPLGYQWWSTHRTLRVLAEQLAADGHLVARLDYDATGDSAGDQWDGDRVAAWRRSVADAVADLRAQGCERLQLVGVRLGATLALLDGQALGAATIAVWAPVASGRRWGRELRLLAEEVPVADDLLEGGTVASAGLVFSAQTLADLGALAVADLTQRPAERVLIVDEQPNAGLVAHLASLDVEVSTQAVGGGHESLDVPTEDAVVPAAIVAALRAWLAPPAGLRDAPTVPCEVDGSPQPARMAWRGQELHETIVALGRDRLAGIRTEPAGGVVADGTLVFLNTGAEPHVGPGRAWVELARTLAARGQRCYRVDWRGWGESPDGGHAPGRPYDPHTVQDTVELVRALRDEGHDDVILCGLCASAWVALRAVLAIDVAGVVALNPQLYWEPGDPVEATMAQTRRRRAQEIADIAAGAVSGRWTTEDTAGARPWAAAWLDALAAAATPITLVFAEGDDGLEYLTTRLERRFAAARRAGLQVVELIGIDHSMHRVWTRGRVADEIAAAVARMRSAG
jgi:pimeloyl-ACP methyl ester carboxylesterase